jgi:DNA polymerase I
LDEANGTLDCFKEYFEDERVGKVWHNYSFDRAILRNHKIDVKGFAGDTMHMARLWDTSRTFDGGYSLEGLSADLLQLKKRPIKERFGSPKIKKDGTDGKEIVIPALDVLQRDQDRVADWIDYSTYDTQATWELRGELEKRLKMMVWSGELSMWDFYQRYLCPFGELLTDMEKNGFKVDVEFLASLLPIAQKDADEAANRFREWAISKCADVKYMNLNSDAQKQQLLFAPVTNSKTGELLEAEREFDV